MDLASRRPRWTNGLSDQQASGQGTKADDAVTGESGLDTERQPWSAKESRGEPWTQPKAPRVLARRGLLETSLMDACVEVVWSRKTSPKSDSFSVRAPLRSVQNGVCSTTPFSSSSKRVLTVD